MIIAARLDPVDVIWRFMSHIVDRKTENYKNLCFVKFHQNLRKWSSLKMVRFFLRSEYKWNIAVSWHPLCSAVACVCRQNKRPKGLNNITRCFSLTWAKGSQGELIAYQWSVLRPFVVHTFKLEYLLNLLANLDQILCVTSLGWGKGCIRFYGRLDQNSGFHGNRKPPLTCNGENDVSTFSRLFLIRSFLYLQVKRTCIKSWTSSNFGQIRPLTKELAALEHLKNFP